MIDGSDKCNRQLAFELQNSHVCEKRSIKLSELQFIWSTMVFNKSKLKILSQILGLLSS